MAARRKPAADPLVDGPLVEALKAQRELLSAAMRSAEPRELAALSREMRQVLTALDDLVAKTGSGSKIDELLARREGRAAGSDVLPVTGRRAQPRRG